MARLSFSEQSWITPPVNAAGLLAARAAFAAPADRTSHALLHLIEK